MTILRTDNVPPVFYFDGIPATFVIAPDGRIAAFEVGAADWTEPHVVDFLEKLAAPCRVARLGKESERGHPDHGRPLDLFIPRKPRL